MSFANEISGAGFLPKRGVRLSKRTSRVVGSTAGNAKVTPSVVSRMISQKLAKNMELKHKDSTRNSATGQSSSAAIDSLTDIASGDTDQTRDGDQLNLVRCFGRINSYISTSDVTADDSNYVRVILFQWFPNTTPTTADILEDDSNYPTQSVYKHDTRFMYTILMDHTFSLCRNGPSNMIHDFSIVNFRKKVQFLANSSSVATNKLYLLRVSDSGTIEHPALGYFIRVLYHDA
jgi:hypothetical protein